MVGESIKSSTLNLFASEHFPWLVTSISYKWVTGESGPSERMSQPVSSLTLSVSHISYNLYQGRWFCLLDTS